MQGNALDAVNRAVAILLKIRIFKLKVCFTLKKTENL